jgi:hypothetical protein
VKNNYSKRKNSPQQPQQLPRKLVIDRILAFSKALENEKASQSKTSN